jgi:hypothetical protein
MGIVETVVQLEVFRPGPVVQIDLFHQVHLADGYDYYTLIIDRQDAHRKNT